jgi:hypothetical protein
MSVHVDPARWEGAEGALRRAMVEHLRSCAACRRAAAAHDPAILFALLDRTPIPAAILDGVSAGLARRLDADRAATGARRATAAAMIALVLVCGYATIRDETVPGGLASRELPFVDHPLAAVDVLPSSGVSGVVDFTVGDTQVVMVYNGDLQL